MLIDRYIARRFLANFIVLFALLFVFAIAIDLILQLDEFMKVARSIAGDDAGPVSLGLTLARIVLNFHGPRVFQFYAFLLGLVSIGAMGFTLAQMHRQRELVAVLASGMSMHRLAMPFLMVAFGLNVVQLLNQEFLLPRVAPMLIRQHGDIGRQAAGAFPVPLTPDSSGAMLVARSFDPRSNILTRPTMLLRDEAGRASGRITADSAAWRPAAQQWRLTNGMLLARSSPEQAARGSAVVHQSIDVLQTDLTPAVLTMRRHSQYASMLSLAQINEMLDAPGVVDAAALTRFKYARFSAVLINLLVLVVSLPFFLLREPGNLLRQCVLCAAVAIPVMIAALIGLTVELRGISPALGVFLPVAVLIPIGLARVSAIRT